MRTVIQDTAIALREARGWHGSATVVGCGRNGSGQTLVLLRVGFSDLRTVYQVKDGQVAWTDLPVSEFRAIGGIEDPLAHVEANRALEKGVA